MPDDQSKSSSDFSDGDEPKKRKKLTKKKFQKHIMMEETAEKENITENNAAESNVTESRKRKRNRKQWKENIIKKLKLQGKEYCNKGKKVPAKKVKEQCNCRRKCYQIFSLQKKTENI